MGLHLAFLLLAFSTLALADPCDFEQFSPENGGSVSLLQSFAQWDDALVKSYLTTPSRKDSPQALPKFSVLDRLRNRIHLFRTGPEVRREAPAAAHAMASSPGMTASQAVEEVARGLSSYHFANRISQDVGRKTFEKIRDSWLVLFKGIGRGDIPFTEVNTFTAGYHNRVMQLQRERGGQFLVDAAAIEKAGFDAFAMFMLARIAGKKPPSMESVYALSLLHPITDNALDSGMELGNSMARLTRLLQGENLIPTNDYESIVFKLVRQIYANFPPEKYPEVQKTLIALQKEQLKSVKLQHEEVADEVRIRNTLRKGAITALMFGYLSFGKLDKGQTEYFYRAGSMLQLVDDLLDVSSDLKEKNQTVWTLAHQRSKGNLNDPMGRLLKSQKELEDLGPELLKDLPNHEDFLNSFNLAFRMFIYSATTDPVVANGTRRTLANRLPLRPEELKRTLFDILGPPEAIPESTRPAMRIFDRGFLDGKYFGESNLHRSQGPGIDIGGRWNPIWWWVRATNAVHRNVNDAYTSGRGPAWLAPVAMLYSFDVLHQYTAAGMGPVGLFGGMGVYKLLKNYPKLGLWGALALVAGGHIANYYTDYPDPIFGSFSPPRSEDDETEKEYATEIEVSSPNSGSEP